MKRVFLIVMVLLLAALPAFAACSISKSADREQNNGSRPSAATADYGLDYKSPEAPAESTPDGSSSAVIGAKVIKNADLTVQTRDFDAFSKSLSSGIEAAGGYVERSDVGGRGYGSDRELRRASMVIRIPADKLDGFLSAVSEIANVVARSENAVDVTSNYVDTEARIKSLRVEYETLLDLLSRAESLDNIITLQDRLSNVRYQIESYEAKLRSYDDLVAYSTVRLEINEVERETVVEKEGFGSEISRRFRESLEDVGSGFRSFAVWFIGDLPHIVITLAIIAGVVFLVLFIVRTVRKSRAKQRAKQAALYTQPFPQEPENR